LPVIEDVYNSNQGLPIFERVSRQLRLWETMKKKAFLSYKVDPKVVDENAKDLSLGDQKRFLLECLDKNHLYVNYSEIDDEEYGVSGEDKNLLLRTLNSLI